MADYLHALRPGTLVDGYEIVSFLGSGGFGITYLARDVALDKLVAIKEYMPSDLAVRQQTLNVSPKSGQDKADFDWGLDRFLDEARTLARFDHPNVVKVSRFFRAHGTAYIVMEHVSGETLTEMLKRKGRLGEAELRGLVEGLLSGLEAVHAADYLHRDIKPGNVILRPDGTPVLLDFGSARQSVTAKSRSVTAIVTPGYAPIEQYSSRGNQGPWTDIYAVGAICYRAMTGEVPVDATERVRRDPLVPASEHAVSKGAYSPALLIAVDEALKVDEDARPQSVAALRAFLSGEESPTEKLAPARPAAPKPSPAQKDPARKSTAQDTPPGTRAPETGRRGLVAAAVFATVLGASGVGLLIDPIGWFDTETEQDAASSAPETLADIGTATVEAAAATETMSDILVGTFRDRFLSGTGQGPEMVVIPAGSFIMGSPLTETGRFDSQGPQRSVTIGSGFAVGRYEVTQGEWNACVAESGCDGYTLNNISGSSNERNPVMRVSWGDAQDYVSWLSRKTGERYRLLSEAEWEYAARAGTTTPFSFGQTISTSQANYNGNYVYGPGVTGEYREQTSPVGSFPANAFGLFDMHGNVWEWTQDCWNGNYNGAPRDGSARTNGDCYSRVVRGGSWFDSPQDLRSAYRDSYDSSLEDSAIGFRVARTV